MTQKLTLLVEEEIIKKSKRYAAKKNISVSKLVEDLLKKTIGAVSDSNPNPFLEIEGMWKGRKISKESLRKKIWREY